MNPDTNKCPHCGAKPWKEDTGFQCGSDFLSDEDKTIYRSSICFANENFKLKSEVASLCDDYYPGKGCECSVHNRSECGCDVDWTDPRIYKLERELTEKTNEVARLREQLAKAREELFHAVLKEYGN